MLENHSFRCLADCDDTRNHLADGRRSDFAVRVLNRDRLSPREGAFAYCCVTDERPIRCCCCIGHKPTTISQEPNDSLIVLLSDIVSLVEEPRSWTFAFALMADGGYTPILVCSRSSECFECGC